MTSRDPSGKSMDCVHPEPDAEVHAVGGHYTFFREVRLPFEGGEVLYFVGAALMDSTCCGSGGCGFASVQGMLERYRYRINDAGRPVSLVRPIADPEIRRALEMLIRKKETVQQVVFAG